MAIKRLHFHLCRINSRLVKEVNYCGGVSVRGDRNVLLIPRVNGFCLNRLCREWAEEQLEWFDVCSLYLWRNRTTNFLRYYTLMVF